MLYILKRFVNQVEVHALSEPHEVKIVDQVEEKTQCELVEERALTISVEALMKSHEERLDDQVEE